MEADCDLWRVARAGTFALQWLDYQRLARAYPGDIYIFLIAAAFLALGVFVGVRVFSGPQPGFQR